MICRVDKYKGEVEQGNGKGGKEITLWKIISGDKGKSFYLTFFLKCL